MRERLIELLKEAYDNYIIDSTRAEIERLTDYLLENGVLVAPMPMNDRLQDELQEHIYQRCVEEL